jgi:hypothetical protein
MISNLKLVEIEQFSSHDRAYHYRMTVEYSIYYEYMYKEKWPITYQDLFDDIHIEEILTDNLIGLS